MRNWHDCVWKWIIESLPLSAVMECGNKEFRDHCLWLVFAAAPDWLDGSEVWRELDLFVPWMVIAGYLLANGRNTFLKWFGYREYKDVPPDSILELLIVWIRIWYGRWSFYIRERV